MIRDAFKSRANFAAGFSLRKSPQASKGAKYSILRLAVARLFAIAALLCLATGSPAQSPAFAGHGFAPVEGTRLYYELKGEGPAVVLIHGGQLDSRMWDDQFDALAKQFTAIRYDVRGYGGSLRGNKPYSDADDLAALLDYLKVTKAHLVGLSLGGRIALDVAVAHPDRVRSLTLAGPGLAGFEAPNAAEVELRMWEIIKAAREDGPDQATDLWLKDPFMVPAMEQPRLAARLRRISRENAHCWLENPVLQRSPKPLAAKRLDTINVPTLLILGDRDVPQIKASIEELEKGIGGSQKVVIKDAGHMVNMERPGAFNETLQTFLAKLK